MAHLHGVCCCLYGKVIAKVFFCWAELSVLTFPECQSTYNTLPDSECACWSCVFLRCFVYMSLMCSCRSDHEPAINDEQERFPTITTMMKAGNMRYSNNIS